MKNSLDDIRYNYHNDSLMLAVYRPPNRGDNLEQSGYESTVVATVGAGSGDHKGITITSTRIQQIKLASALRMSLWTIFWLTL